MILEKAKKLLKDHQVRKTDIREQVLTVFLNNDQALSNHDIEYSLSTDIDRITLYRTLNTFVEHGIIHRIENASEPYYALCRDCEYHDHDDNHVHFQCTQCDKIECFDQHQKLNFEIPAGYQLEKMNILLKGICLDCVR